MANNDKKNYGYQSVLAIAKYFDVSSDYLLGLTNAKSNNKDIQFICDYTYLSEKAIKQLNENKNILLNYSKFYNKTNDNYMLFLLFYFDLLSHLIESDELRKDIQGLFFGYAYSNFENKEFFETQNINKTEEDFFVKLYKLNKWFDDLFSNYGKTLFYEKYSNNAIENLKKDIAAGKDNEE